LKVSQRIPAGTAALAERSVRMKSKLDMVRTRLLRRLLRRARAARVAEPDSTSMAAAAPVTVDKPPPPSPLASHPRGRLWFSAMRLWQKKTG
jgi:hypothetical protein